MHRIGQLAALLANHAGCSERESELIRLAVFLHDVGKAAVPEHILTKPGPLSAEERAIIDTHPRAGHAMLAQSKSHVHELAAVMALEHHERWDGAGYPQGLRAEGISLAGRIAAIADVMDSLLNVCSYRDAWPLDEVCRYVAEQAGKQFDPALAATLISHRAEVDAIYR